MPQMILILPSLPSLTWGFNSRASPASLKPILSDLFGRCRNTSCCLEARCGRELVLEKEGCHSNLSAAGPGPSPISQTQRFTLARPVPRMMKQSEVAKELVFTLVPGMLGCYLLTHSNEGCGGGSCCSLAPGGFSFLEL